jgi:hypothetical protein
MPEQKHLPGAMQDPTMKAIMDMAKLASGFMKNGGRAEYQEGGAPEDEPASSEFATPMKIPMSRIEIAQNFT